MTLGKPLGKGQSEGQGMGFGSALGLGMPYSLLLAPNSYLPSPSWSPSLYLTYPGTTRQAGFPPLATLTNQENQP